MTYDGFGNLVQKVSSNAPSLSLAVDPATNRLQTNASYDANGNLTGYAGDGYGYDLRNRMIQANPMSGGTVLYGYDTTNHRVYKGAYNGGTYSAEEIYFYGVEGQQYGTWQLNPSSGVLLQASVAKQWFGSRLVSPEDRLGSKGKYFAFGEERTNVNPANPPNDQEKFATYTRDNATGLDYANQRYYSSTIGRFTRPDPFEGSANAADPQSWNRYAYVQNDPANNTDPRGLYVVDCMWDGCPNLHNAGGGGGDVYAGYYSSDPGISGAGPLANSEQQNENQYLGNLQQTTTDVQAANAANQAIANGDPATASAIAAANPDLKPAPVAPTTADPVYNAYAGLAPSLNIDPNAIVPVRYQQQGVGTVIQPINTATNAPYQLDDLSFDPDQIGTSDPAWISAIFHGAGNPVWYIGGATNPIHLVNLQNVQNQPVFILVCSGIQMLTILLGALPP